MLLPTAEATGPSVYAAQSWSTIAHKMVVMNEKRNLRNDYMARKLQRAILVAERAEALTTRTMLLIARSYCLLAQSRLVLGKTHRPRGGQQTGRWAPFASRDVAERDTPQNPSSFDLRLLR